MSVDSALPVRAFLEDRSCSCQTRLSDSVAAAHAAHMTCTPPASHKTTRGQQKQQFVLGRGGAATIRWEATSCAPKSESASRADCCFLFPPVCMGDPCSRCGLRNRSTA